MTTGKLLAAALAAGIVIPGVAVAAEKVSLEAIVANPARTEAEKARDQYRHPVQTLKFFGIKPNMTVVEVSPSGGWYTAILAPYLKDKGKLYAAHNNPAASERAATAVKTYTERFGGIATVTVFGKGMYDIAPKGSADAVLTFRNVHNWHGAGFAPDAFAAFNRALKKGGVLGVEEHRLPEGRPDEAQQSSGYMKTSTVVKLAEAAGFKLAKQSEINANPKDTADWPKGVWTLPPNYREGEVDKAKYAAIGESDRMTLKFVKVREL